jgi:hypothetical protein
MRISKGLQAVVSHHAAQLGRCSAPGATVMHDVVRIEFVYRGKRYAVVPCPGSAHSNAFVDGCALCLGVTWGATLELL